jgi:hypothetical protein
MDASGRVVFARDLGRVAAGRQRIQLDASPFRGLCIARAVVNGEVLVARSVRE